MADGPTAFAVRCYTCRHLVYEGNDQPSDGQILLTTYADFRVAPPAPASTWLRLVVSLACPPGRSRLLNAPAGRARASRPRGLAQSPADRALRTYAWFWRSGPEGAARAKLQPHRAADRPYGADAVKAGFAVAAPSRRP